MNLLIFYEMAEKAKKVIDKQTYFEFRNWAHEAVQKYKDKAVERQVNMYLFQMKLNFN